METHRIQTQNTEHYCQLHGACIVNFTAPCYRPPLIAILSIASPSLILVVTLLSFQANIPDVPIRNVYGHAILIISHDIS